VAQKAIGYAIATMTKNHIGTFSLTAQRSYGTYFNGREMRFALAAAFFRNA
jgi:hypothetical protein